jgi:peptidoglycan hydrolase-like protein with peptidoglycan-binding domain
MTGDDVKKMQHYLNRSIPPLSLPDLREDGIFGSKTLGALREFQKLRELAVDGVYGDHSRTALTAFHVVENDPFFRAATRSVWAHKVGYEPPGGRQ